MTPMITKSLLLACCALAAAPGASAQTLATAQTPEPIAMTGAFRIPIHAIPADGTHGDHGLWASGDDYKVSFHDGFTFYPVLGKQAPENLPLRWTTTAITIGGGAIADPARIERKHAEWRCEYRIGIVVEAYDVLPNGVEQTFVIAERPVGLGDLVIEGAVATRLVARPAEAAVQDLEFADGGGIVRVRYGKATAIDARGDRTPVTTEWDGERVRLVVAGEWLASAAFPVVVDPLTVANPYAPGLGSDPVSVSVHRQDESAVHNTAVAFVRASSGFDNDLFVWTGTPDLSTSAPIFTEVVAGWSSQAPDVSYVGGADRWIVGFWRQFTNEDRVCVYFHDRDSTLLNTGVLDATYRPAGEFASFPVVGGSSHPTLGTRGVMVYRMDPVHLNSSTSQLHAIVLDAGAQAFGQRLVVENTMNVENADISCQLGWNDDGWVLVYPGRTSPIDDYDVYARRITVEPSLSVTPAFLVGPDNLGDKGNPAVAGQDGHYMVAMIQDGTMNFAGSMHGNNILATRLDWASMASARSAQPHRTVATSTMMDLIHPTLAFDTTTRSHWCLLYDSNTFVAPIIECRRLGQTGGVVESATVAPSCQGSAAAFDPATNRFQIMTCSADQTGALYGQLLSYPPTAVNVPFGSPCGPGIATSDTIPLAGNEHYGVRLFGAPAGNLAALMFSMGAGSTPLGPLGAPGCTQYLASTDVSVLMIVDPQGEATFTLRLPDAPVLRGDLFWQFVYLWPSAPTQLQVGVTNGLRTQVR